MHSKEKGNLGELVAMKHLLSCGYPVFTEFGDNSKVDLIALVDNEPVKIQVKTRTSESGKVQIDSRKSGPNYKFRYSLDHVDVFAIYVIDRDVLFFVNAKELLSNRTWTTYRLDPTKNGQKYKVLWVKDRMSFEEALRGHTCDTQTGKAVGEEMVQTTTVDQSIGL